MRPIVKKVEFPSIYSLVELIEKIQYSLGHNIEQSEDSERVWIATGGNRSQPCMNVHGPASRSVRALVACARRYWEAKSLLMQSAVSVVVNIYHPSFYFWKQATELKCGGLVLACTFDHRIADAYSTNMFLVAWAETAASKPISLPPSFRRSLLIPRRPGSHDSSLDRLYVPISSLPPPPSSDQEAAVNRIYVVAADDIARIQAAAGCQRTKIEAFTGYLWRVLARGARPEDKVCRMGAVVDGRTRLARGGEMAGYFGNVLSIPYGSLRVEELKDMDLAEAAEAVHGWLRRATTEEHFRGLVDWVEARRPEPSVARIYIGEEDVGVGCVVSSGRAFPVGEVEFGWGKAVFGSYHFPWGGSAGYVMPMPSARRNGDWVVYMHLLKNVLDVLEAEEPPVFRPLTADYFLADAN